MRNRQGKPARIQDDHPVSNPSSFRQLIKDNVTHFIIFAFFGIVVVAAGSSGGFADSIGWSLLDQHFGDEAHRAVGIHSAWWDVGRIYLPDIQAVWLADTIVFSQLFLGMTSIFYKCKSPVGAFHRLSAFCLIYGVILFLRTITIYSTVHSVSPVVAQRLKNGETISDIKQSIGYIANTNCFDMMFSGHASSDIVMMMFSIYSRAPLFLKFVTSINGMFGAVSLIMVGDHYTSDVIVAVYTTLLVFYLFKHRFTSACAE